MIFHRYISLILSMLLLLTGCNTLTHNDAIFSDINNKVININYENNNSWSVSGNGNFELVIYKYSDNALQEYYSEQFSLNDNQITMTFSLDDNLNISFQNSITNDNQFIQSETSYLKTDMDTSYVQTEKSVLLENQALPVFMICKNMTSIQSDFNEDYSSLRADYAIIIVLKNVS